MTEAPKREKPAMMAWPLNVQAQDPFLPSTVIFPREALHIHGLLEASTRPKFQGPHLWGWKLWVLPCLTPWRLPTRCLHVGS